MKYNASIPGKRLRKETRSSLVRIGKEIASLSDVVLNLVSNVGFVYSDGQNSFEIKVSRNLAQTTTTEDEV